MDGSIMSNEPPYPENLHMSNEPPRHDPRTIACILGEVTIEILETTWDKKNKIILIRWG